MCVWAFEQVKLQIGRKGGRMGDQTAHKFPDPAGPRADISAINTDAWNRFHRCKMELCAQVFLQPVRLALNPAATICVLAGKV